MNIPVNLFMWVLACLPIIVLLVLMIKFQWGATDAAPVGLAITVFTGIVFYKADLKVIVSEEQGNLECIDHSDHCMDGSPSLSGRERDEGLLRHPGRYESSFKRIAFSPGYGMDL